MPRVFDNIEQELLTALTETLKVSERADFCIGYFNLRGWRALGGPIEGWPGGDGKCCRVLIGMQRTPQEELHMARSLLGGENHMDMQHAARLRRELAEDFRNQLLIGAPSNAGEASLQKLRHQLLQEKLKVKLHLRHPLHAKLYLLFRKDPVAPITAYLGSSNLTMAGLSKQGELNIDIVEQDACQKLQKWFEARWEDNLCVDISAELAEIIEESWAREQLIPPHHIYLKIAYHLSQEAREGLAEFHIPSAFQGELLDFQIAAVKIAAHHLVRRKGVLIGDVVGLGKTLMAAALARIFEDAPHNLETLILCPKNLVPMWENYRSRYGLRAIVISTSKVEKLRKLTRYRTVIIDESHNFRNREGKRYRIIQEYIRKNDSQCILLSATPYNKTYQDLSSQLRLFIPEHKDLGIRPEHMLRNLLGGEKEFTNRHQAPIRSIAAFEKSEQPDDWRDLMRLYLVRRTRSFIQKHYADTDANTGRCFLRFEDGTRSYFPDRVPKTVKFGIDGQYAQLFSESAVTSINSLKLPRYGLGNYHHENPAQKPTPQEQEILNDLSRAGKRMMGFCRTNLLKRLESSGYSFLLSLRRHILRNYIFIHAIENGLHLPIGETNISGLDSKLFDGDEADAGDLPISNAETALREQAARTYQSFQSIFKSSFRWIAPHHFGPLLIEDLQSDAMTLLQLLAKAGDWQPGQDAKLHALHKLLTEQFPQRKVLVFSQFADTVRYLAQQLQQRGVQQLAEVTGDSENPTRLAWRFSPKSNARQSTADLGGELRVLIATDVLSEGQNLQDCAIVVNYDLPWAIVRLIQRAGRVDRIGQQADQIQCFSFLPADGIERQINLRGRVRRRLKENAEVVGTDEAFFEDEEERAVVDLYSEKAGILDEEEDDEVDLSSYALQIWKEAVDADPSLKNTIEALPNVVHSSKAHASSPEAPAGALVHIRTSQQNDALAWVGPHGEQVTQSPFEILRAAQCPPETPALPRAANHHRLVSQAAAAIAEEEQRTGGQLGRPSGARYRTYERLKRYAEQHADTPLLISGNLHRAIGDIYQRPLRPEAASALKRLLDSNATDEQLAAQTEALRNADLLCQPPDKASRREPQIICSLGLIPSG